MLGLSPSSDAEATPTCTLSLPAPNSNPKSELGNELDLNKENMTDEEDEGRCVRPP